MISSWIAKLRGNSPEFAAISPDAPLFVIGDIHGRADLLLRALAKLTPGVPIVCVGDLIDRGEQSSEVLSLLADRPDILCLKGNHEDMLLQFLDDPVAHGARWLRYGGLQTLASFGVTGVTETSPAEARVTARDALKVNMGPDLENWLRRLPLSHQSGNLVVVHAAANPRVEMREQQPRHLLWGHPDFLRVKRSDGLWVAHGHTVVETPYAKDGRIAVDTGAYATGALTIADISAAGVRFITA